MAASTSSIRGLAVRRAGLGPTRPANRRVAAETATVAVGGLYRFSYTGRAGLAVHGFLLLSWRQNAGPGSDQPTSSRVYPRASNPGGYCLLSVRCDVCDVFTVPFAESCGVRPEVIPSCGVRPEVIPACAVRPEVIPSCGVRPEVRPSCGVRPEVIPASLSDSCGIPAPVLLYSGSDGSAGRQRSRGQIRQRATTFPSRQSGSEIHDVRAPALNRLARGPRRTKMHLQ